MKKILYLDMDGVVNLFEKDPNARINMWNDGYFVHIPPRENIENDLILISNYVDQIILLTKCIERKGVKKEKDIFVSKWLSNVPNLSIIYVPYNESKSKYIDTSCFSIIVDDQIKNLKECENLCDICVLFDEENTHQYINKINRITDLIMFIA